MTAPVRRTGARVFLFDDSDRVLLIEERFVEDGRQLHHWLTPGGGVEAGEDLVTAALRELFEETSIRVELSADAPQVHHQRREWSWDGVTYDQDDHFFAARVGAPWEVRPAALTPMEQSTVVGNRWWTLEELRASTDTFLPPDIVAVVEVVLAGGYGALVRPQRRLAGRALLVDPADRVLMIRSVSPDGEINWVSPGGGCDPGETTRQAAQRELSEETGLAMPIAEGAEAVHTERAVFSFGPWMLDQTDDYYAVPVGAEVPAAPISRARLSPIEVNSIVEYRWLSAPEIRAMTERIWPFGLADLLDSLAAAPGARG
ncbi:MAG: NUDIX hydrolase [Jatrophihabitans sp.]